MSSRPSIRKCNQLYILGDSYSDIGWRYPYTPLPSRARRLGIEHPCDWVTWMSREQWQDNWVQHLIVQSHAPQLRVYDFAVGGAFLADIEQQVNDLEALQAEHRVEREKALLVLWVGVNDVTSLRGDPQFIKYQMEPLLKRCYDLGLRHLVFFDVPPRIQPRPGQEESLLYRTIRENIAKWNSILPEVVEIWRSLGDGATAKLFSAHQVFDNILRNPNKYGFKESDSYATSGGIWVDGLHLTTKVHEILGRAIRESLD